MPVEQDLPQQYREKLLNVYGNGRSAYLEHAVDAVTNGSPSLVDGLEVQKSHKLITVLYESIETKREVPMHFRTTKCRLGYLNS